MKCEIYKFEHFIKSKFIKKNALKFYIALIISHQFAIFLYADNLRV